MQETQARHTMHYLARFLVGATQNDKDLKALMASFQKLRDLLVEQEEVQKIFASPLINAQEKIKFLKILGASLELHAVFLDFLEVLAQHMLLGLLPGIFDFFETFVLDRAHTTEVLVRSASPLDRDAEKSLEAWLQKKIPGTLLLTQEIDPTLLGGFQVSWRGQFLDASLKSQLVSLTTALKG